MPATTTTTTTTATISKTTTPKIIKADTLIKSPSSFQNEEHLNDIEDIPSKHDFMTLHKDACETGKLSYKDPETGYHVFTELAHTKRGKCCGSGCRHCPYNHENVEQKSQKIMQPAFLYLGEEEETVTSSNSRSIADDISKISRNNMPLPPTQTSTLTNIQTLPPSDETHLFTPNFLVDLKSITQQLQNEPIDDKHSHNIEVSVIFFSGGKDSFLAIRAIIRKFKHMLNRKKNNSNWKHSSKLCIILLTTFCARSRIVAHQEIPIHVIEKQARHLGIPLLGVPLHSNSSETYVEIIERALNVIRKVSNRNIDSLVFGDLHLDHIRSWRDKEFQSFNIPLEYPLWKVSYECLINDLQDSSIDVTVSASTVDWVKQDETFNDSLMNRSGSLGADEFGENGEFHTIAKVWATSRERALGLV